MRWDEIRHQHPHCWVLVEALDAHTQGTERVIHALRLVGVFGEDWDRAWDSYKRAHHADRNREYYVLHTDREDLNIGVIDSFGRVLQ